MESFFKSWRLTLPNWHKCQPHRHTNSAKRRHLTKKLKVEKNCVIQQHGWNGGEVKDWTQSTTIRYISEQERSSERRSGLRTRAAAIRILDWCNFHQASFTPATSYRVSHIISSQECYQWQIIIIYIITVCHEIISNTAPFIPPVDRITLNKIRHRAKHSVHHAN